MTDQPTGPEKPTRRRSAPRKRKPAKSIASADRPAELASVAPIATPVEQVAPAAGAAPDARARTPRAPRSPRPPRQPRQPAAPVEPQVAAPPPAAVASESTNAAPAPRQLVRVPLSVRWRDLDAFNHVNNSKYLSYLEEARLRWMLSVPGMGMDDDVAPVVAASNLNYRRPIGWPGDVVVELFVERLGSSSITIGHRIIDAADDGATYCDGQVVMVWIDRNSGRAAPLPDAVRTACS